MSQSFACQDAFHKTNPGERYVFICCCGIAGEVACAAGRDLPFLSLQLGSLLLDERRLDYVNYVQLPSTLRWPWHSFMGSQALQDEGEKEVSGGLKAASQIRE